MKKKLKALMSKEELKKLPKNPEGEPVNDKPKLKLDLACGQRCTPGYIGVDRVQVPGVMVVHDLTEIPFPFDDESVVDIVCNHFFEHMDGAERINFMEEVYRILIPGGKIVLQFPYWSSKRAIQDPTHKWPPLHEDSFLYYDAAWMRANGLDHYDIKCDFDRGWDYFFNGRWQSRSQEALPVIAETTLNAVDDLRVTLTKRPREMNLEKPKPAGGS